jgi:hypothetical protein
MGGQDVTEHWVKDTWLRLPEEVIAEQGLKDK